MGLKALGLAVALPFILMLAYQVYKMMMQQNGTDGKQRQQRSLLERQMQVEKEVVIGNKTYHPSFGLFPRGCKWRSVTMGRQTA